MFLQSVFRVQLRKCDLSLQRISLVPRKNEIFRKRMFSGIRRKLSGFHCVRNVDYESNEFREGIAAIVRDYLTGKWRGATSNNLLIQKLKGGLSNSVFEVALPHSGDEASKVIMRFHQPFHQDTLHEYMSESVAFTVLSEHKFGPKLLGIFPGGRIEEHIEARPLKTEELMKKNFSSVIAEKMAVVHSMNLPLAKKHGIMFDIMIKWLVQIKKDCANWKIENSDMEKCVGYFKQFDLEKEIDWLRNFLIDKDSTVTFCHNDLQEGNILVKLKSVNTEKPELIFIDYEYSFYNYRAFELANHFLEYTMNYESKNYPYFVVNDNYYPSKEEQLQFFRRYLKVSKELKEGRWESGKIENDFTGELEDGIRGNDGISEMEDKLFRETSKFRLASHLLWGIWAALRSQSQIDFGYWEYCNTRLKAYNKLKEELQT